MKTALLSLILLAATSIPPAEAASSQVRVSVTVLPRVRLTAVRQTPTITVTERDVERGFVEVGSGTQFELTSNTPTQFQVTAMGDWFQAVRVDGLPSGALELASTPSVVALLPAFINQLQGWHISGVKPHPPRVSRRSEAEPR